MVAVELKLDWFNWEIYASLGIATSIVYLFKYYYPALDAVKDKLKEQDIDVKELAMFNYWRIGFMSLVYGIVYSVLFPILLLGILFGGSLLQERTEKLLMKEALSS